MTAGQQFVKMIRPGGAALFLIVFVLFLVTCFTLGSNPVPGYEAPNTSEYYSQHLEALEAELEQNLFPHLQGIEDCYVNGGALAVVIADENYITARAAILKYYDQTLFELIRN